MFLLIQFSCWTTFTVPCWSSGALILGRVKFWDSNVYHVIVGKSAKSTDSVTEGLKENREEVTKIECFASHYLNRILLLGSCLVWFSGFCTMSLQALCSYHIFSKLSALTISSSSKATFSLDLNISFGVVYWGWVDLFLLLFLSINLVPLIQLVPSLKLLWFSSGLKITTYIGAVKRWWKKKIQDWCPRIEGTWWNTLVLILTNFWCIRL